MGSPLYKRRMEKQGVSDLLNQVVEDNRFLIVQDANKDTLWLEIMMQEKGYEAEPVVIDEILTPGGRAFHVIQMQ